MAEDEKLEPVKRETAAIWSGRIHVSKKPRQAAVVDSDSLLKKLTASIVVDV